VLDVFIAEIVVAGREVFGWRRGAEGGRHGE
jgi:hypothetical protein